MNLIELYLQELFGKKEIEVETAGSGLIIASHSVEDMVGPESILDFTIKFIIPVDRDKYMLLFSRLEDAKYNYKPTRNDGLQIRSSVKRSLYFPWNVLQQLAKTDKNEEYFVHNVDKIEVKTKTILRRYRSDYIDKYLPFSVKVSVSPNRFLAKREFEMSPEFGNRKIDWMRIPKGVLQKNYKAAFKKSLIDVPKWEKIG